jgi:hypothetical protein
MSDKIEDVEITLNAVWEFFPSKGYGPHWYATSPEVPGLHLVVKSMDLLLTEAAYVAKKLFQLNHGRTVSATIVQINLTQSVEEGI